MTQGTHGPDGKDSYNPYAAPVAMIQPPLRYGASGGASGAPAPRGTRFVARVVDNLLFGLSAVPVLVAIFAAKGSALGFAAGVIPLAFVALQSYLVAATGQSVAKKWMGIAVVKMDGTPAGFVSAVVLREWILAVLGFIPGVGALVRLTDSLWIFGDESRCLHDMVAGTKVVLRPRGA